MTPLFSKTPIGKLLCICNFFGRKFIISFIPDFLCADLISCKFFAKEKVSAEDLFSVMKLTNGKVASYDGEEEVVVESHHDFFNGPMKETIFGWTNEQRSEFLFFCTGYKYLPNDDKFFLEVSFDLSKNSYPKAHSCVPQLRLPENAFCGDKIAFQNIINEAIQSHAGGLMSMN